MSRIIFFIMLYLLYRAIKSWYLSNFSTDPEKVSGKKEGSREDSADLMIQDPYCKIYFPRREGVHLKADGRDLYFCSEKCKNGYLSTLK
ncbi:MAG: hypothetical protein KJ737_16260 [Proteobacteria bacterium]|nr:hypothetical protein [Pseudomonadota bacterium]